MASKQRRNAHSTTATTVPKAKAERLKDFLKLISLVKEKVSDVLAKSFKLDEADIVVDPRKFAPRAFFILSQYAGFQKQLTSYLTEDAILSLKDVSDSYRVAQVCPYSNNLSPYCRLIIL